MKSRSIFCLLLISLFFACKKQALEPIPNDLVGKWVFTEYYYSIGGPGSWNKVNPPGNTIEFKRDGLFVSTDPGFSSINQYIIVDSITIKLQPASTPLGYFLMKYQIKTAERALYMYPIEPMCIEGCGYKFER